MTLECAKPTGESPGAQETGRCWGGRASAIPGPGLQVPPEAPFLLVRGARVDAMFRGDILSGRVSRTMTRSER